MSVVWIYFIPLSYLYFTTEYDKQMFSSSKSTPKVNNKRNIFAPASPAFSSKAGVLSYGPRKASLRASDTGMDIV